MKRTYRVSILAVLFSLVVGLVVHSDTQTPQYVVERAEEEIRANGGNPFDEIQERIEAAGGYGFVAEVEQTLIPRPLPANIGKGAERVDSQVTGQVILPDYVQMTLRFEAGANLPPLTIEQDGADSYLIKDGERTRVENPLGAFAPTGDLASYLHAATNVQLKEDAEQPQFTIYTFDIDGPRFADYVRDMVQRQLPPDQQGAIIAPSPILQGMSGHGELWVDGNGLPRRQIIDTLMPEINDLYDSQSHIVADFNFDQASSIEQPTTDRYREPPVSSVQYPTPSSSGDPLIRVTLVLFTLLFCLALISRARWLSIPLSMVLIVIFTTSPTLRGVAYAKQAAERAATPTLLEALGVENAEETAPAPATNTPHATAARMRAAASNNDECGSGDKVTDSDFDGITDYVELCLGTDRYYYDSDQDGITDTLEIQGFVFTTTLGITTTFYSNPTNVDSNGDGMVDYLEWPAPVGSAGEWDPDGDDIPNLWDDDNDGDGLPDSLDMDPFAVTDYGSSFSLQTTRGDDGFDGFQYIAFQIQPQDEDHLRYTTTALDWPYDEEGSVQDLDNSTGDLTLTPILKVTTNNIPAWRTLREEYGVSAFQRSRHEYEMYVMLSPISDGGRIVAFEGSIAYANPEWVPDALDDITWSSMELVWMERAHRCPKRQCHRHRNHPRGRVLGSVPHHRPGDHQE